jgi:hypothetical protein
MEIQERNRPDVARSHRRSLRLRLRLWTIAAFVATLALFTVLGIVSERREMLRTDTAQANVLLTHLARMPEFQSTRAAAGEHIGQLREALTPGGADLELVSVPTEGLPASRPAEKDRITLASRTLDLRDGTWELRYAVSPDRYREALRRSIAMHSIHALLALAVLIAGFEWILRRHLVRPLRAIAYQIHLMRRGGWSPDLPAADRELDELERAVGTLGPVLEGQVHQWIEAERRVAMAEVIRSLWRSIEEPSRRVRALASDLQAQHLVAPGGARKLRGLLADLDRIQRAIDLEEWHRLGPVFGAAGASGPIPAAPEGSA